MALKEYKPGTTFPGRMGRTIGESDPAWPSPLRAKEGAPNVLFIVIDDTGFGQLGCYGSPINTPNIDKLAKNGLLFTNMHTTALCSPSRSCILTGRNHHSNAMSCITEGSTGYPGGNGAIPFENGFLSEMLLQQGYATYCDRQVAPDAFRADQRRRPLRPLAARARLRALLWLSRRRHASILSRPRLRQSSGRAAENPGRGLSPHRRSCRQGDRLHRRPEASRARQAVLPLFRAGREPRAPSCSEGMGRQIQGQVRRRLGRLSREGVRAAERAGHHAEGRQALAPRPRRAGMGEASGRRAQALCAHDGGVRGLLRAHGPPCRPADRFSRTSRRARQYADHVHLRQWRELRGRPARVGQREQVLQQCAGRSEAEFGGDRRTRRPEIFQSLRLGMDARRQHAVQALEARNLSRRHVRSVPRSLAEGHQGQGQGLPPVRARDRHGPERARGAWGRSADASSRRHANRRSKA